MSFPSDKTSNIVKHFSEISDYGIDLSCVIILRLFLTFALKPDCTATQRTCGFHVFTIAICHNDNFFWFETGSLNTEPIYGWIWFTDTHDAALHYMREYAIKAEGGKHRMYVSKEVAHEDKRIFVVQLPQHLTRRLHIFQRKTVAIAGYIVEESLLPQG